jgi:hypothetical protein
MGLLGKLIGALLLAGIIAPVIEGFYNLFSCFGTGPSDVSLDDVPWVDRDGQVRA